MTRWLLLVVLLAFLVRLPLLWGGFVDFDDQILLYGLRDITWLDDENFSKVAFTNYRNERQNLMHVANQLDWAASGGSYFGFILPNLLWWSITCVVVYGFAGLWLRDPRSRLAAVLLFSVHAVNTDTLGWISARGHLIGLPFALGALTVWGTRPRDRLAPVYLLASTALLGLAIYAKLIFVGAFAGFFLVDHHQARGFRSWSSWADKLPALLLVLLVTPMRSGHPTITPPSQLFYARVAGFVEYVFALIVPVPTSLEVWYAPGMTLFDTGGSGMWMTWMPPAAQLVSLLVIAGGLLALYRRGHRVPLLLAVLAIALIGPSMLTRIRPPGIAIGFRYLLAASALFSIALVSLLEDHWDQWSRRERSRVVGVFLAYVVLHAGFSHVQARAWMDQEQVFARCRQYYPVTWPCYTKAQRVRAIRTGDPRAGLGLLMEAAYQRRWIQGRGRTVGLAYMVAQIKRGDPDERAWLLRSLRDDEPDRNRRERARARLAELDEAARRTKRDPASP